LQTGRPSDYDPKYNQEMLDFFNNWEEYRLVKKEVVSNGVVKIINEEKPNKPPTINKFSIKIGVCRKTLNNWCDAHPEFLRTYTQCKAIQEEFLCDKGLLGEYNQGITRLMLVNHSEIKDKMEIDQTNESKVKIELAYKSE
jgi:hypothetical protein